MEIRLFFGIVVLTCGGCGMPAVENEADVLFVNATVWTAGGQDAEALAVRGERILAVGSEAQMRRHVSSRSEIVDLAGNFLMPGFIDNHTHFVDGGFQLLGVDLRSAGDEAEFARRIGEYAAKLPEGTWITGGDWDHEAWPSRRIPHRGLIDEATPRTPVLVNRLDGHMALANSLALQLAGIDRDTPDPQGGEIVRDERGRPTGMLKDAAMNLVQRVISPPSPEETERAAEAAFEHARRMGVTAVTAMVSYSDLRALQQLLEENRVTARVYAVTPLPDFERWSELGVERGFGGDLLQVGALKGFMDGSLGSATAWFYDPYLDSPETRGLPSEMWFPEGNMNRLIEGADRANLQLAVHAIGDRANDLLLDMFQQAAEVNGERDRRFRIEHVQHLTREAVSRLSDLGVIASMQPYHAIDDGRWAENRIGPERIKTTYAFRSLIDAGAIVTFGSDWTVAPLNPLLGVYAAVTRRTLDGKNPEGWVPEERISVEEALICYTKNNAYAMFMERDLGVLEPGKLADLAVLSADPRKVDPGEIQDIQVMRTVLAGKTVHVR